MRKLASDSTQVQTALTRADRYSTGARSGEPSGARDQARFFFAGYATGCGVAPQISSAYCWIVRSLENLPEPAMLRMLFFAHSSGLR